MNRSLSPQEMVRAGLCIGCGICVGQSAAPGARMQFDLFGQLKPHGSTDWLQTGPAHFHLTCPFSPLARNESQLAAELFPDAKTCDDAIGRFQSAYVGHVSERDFREQGSSGGMVTWVAAELLRRGLVDGVAHVVAAEDPHVSGRFFEYRISRTEAEVRAGAKSRYYPVELSRVLENIRATPGRYAIVAIPCFVKAIHLLRREDPLFRERIRFTLGLFCGHMKSARFVESLAWQMNVPLCEVQQVEFRHKDPSRPANWYNARLTLRDGTLVSKDWWRLADGDWGAGFFMNSACNFCDDVVAETADISFGDAWVEPYSSDGRGANVIVVRAPVLDEIVASAIREGRLTLCAVDQGFVEQTQAAGLRQRREGLAYRLSWLRRSFMPRKRVRPGASSLAAQRKLIYRMRYAISAWSHRLFWLSYRLKWPGLYLRWARMASAAYFGLAYHRGKIGEMIKRLKEYHSQQEN